MSAKYGAVQFRDAAAVFDKHVREAPLNAVMLRARIYLRHDDPAAVIGLLSDRKIAEASLRAEASMLLGAAQARMKRFSEADEDFELALRCAKQARDRDLIAEISYRCAIRYALEKRGPEARRELAEARKGPSRRAQIKAAEGESFLLASEKRYADQARVLKKLLEDLDPHKAEFLDSRAWATHTLAVLARELYLPDTLPLVERHLEAAEWPEELKVNQFQAFKAVGWARALRGDYFNAFRYLKKSLNVAPNPAWKAMAYADRAYLARCIGEVSWSRQELAEAEEIAANVEWQSMRGEEPIALLLIAELFARDEPGRAAYYVARFDELGEVRNRLLHFRNDERSKYLADYSRGVVEVALGNKKRGAKLLSASEGFFASIGYDWRAGRADLDLYELTADRSSLQRAAKRLEHYMSSWLGNRFNALSGSSLIDLKLPPMQRKVFDGICRGLSNAEIAKELSRSEFTVANHVKALLKTFRVASRSALLAEAMRRKML